MRRFFLLTYHVFFTTIGDVVTWIAMDALLFIVSQLLFFPEARQLVVFKTR